MADNGRPTWFVTRASSGFDSRSRAKRCGARQPGRPRARSARPRLARSSWPRAGARAQPGFSRSTSRRAARRTAPIAAALARFGRHRRPRQASAGYGVVGAIEETPEAELRAQIETNFFGAVAVTPGGAAAHAVAPRRSDRRCLQCRRPAFLRRLRPIRPRSSPWKGLSRALALEMAPFGAEVMIVEPGDFRTGSPRRAALYADSTPTARSSATFANSLAAWMEPRRRSRQGGARRRAGAGGQDDAVAPAARRRWASLRCAATPSGCSTTWRNRERVALDTRVDGANASGSERKMAGDERPSPSGRARAPLRGSAPARSGSGPHRRTGLRLRPRRRVGCDDRRLLELGAASISSRV